MQLTLRDIKVLKALDKLRVMDIDTIQKLCGFPAYNKCADRLAILYKNNYLQFEQFAVSTKRYYFLTQKGMNVICPGEKRISKSGKEYIFYRDPPAFNISNLNHELITAKVLVYVLKCNPELTIDDFKSDREMQSFSYLQRKTFRHCCDLLCEKYRVKIEVELSKKDNIRISRNISLNNNTYVQLWIASQNDVYNRLIKEKSNYRNFNIVVVKLDELEKEPIILSKLYEDLLKSNPKILNEIRELEELRKKKAKQLSINDIG
ncbi:hypothetical protein [Clostridium sp.]|uniref:hypothetical protein n=1 Tax=Clostridium sp. TaxID=1506 RepID=UPI0025C484C8|nr:hypothetical protein [Clostridium sp.]